MCGKRSNGCSLTIASRHWPWWRSGLAGFLFGHFFQGRRWIQRALEGAGVGFAPARARLLAAAELSSAISDFGYGLQCARQAQQLFQQLGDRRGEIDARLTIALARYAGELADLRR